MSEVIWVGPLFVLEAYTFDGGGLKDAFDAASHIRYALRSDCPWDETDVLVCINDQYDVGRSRGRNVRTGKELADPMVIGRRELGEDWSAFVEKMLGEEEDDV